MSRNHNNRRNATRNSTAFEPLESRQLMSAGDLDPTFGQGGKMRTNFGFGANDVVVQNDGKVVMVGSLNGDFAVARMNANGTPDTTFGGGDGLVTTALQTWHTASAQQVAVQSDGKLVVGGLEMLAVNTGRWAMTRYNADGSLDATFGDGGKEYLFDWQEVTGYGVYQPGITDLAIDKSGKILFTATRAKHVGIFNDLDFDFFVGRLNNNGVWDSTFGDARGSGRAGYAQTGMGLDDVATCLTVQLDGRIIVGGVSEHFEFSGDNDTPRFAIARYTSDGRLDKTFDGDGKLTTKMYVPSDVITTDPTMADSGIAAITTQADGKIIATGFTGDILATLRYNSNGLPDATFGTLRMGVHGAFTDLSSTQNDASVSVYTRNDRILVVANTTSTGHDTHFTSVAQYTADGSLDSSFGQGGIVKVSSDPNRTWSRGALTTDGKIVVAASNKSASTLARISDVMAPPTVQVWNWVTSAAEVSSSSTQKPGYFMVTRNARYTFATRVFLNFTGTASLNKDYYTTLAQSKLGGLMSRSFGGGGEKLPTNNQFYVDIPANQTYVLVPVYIIDDSLIEQPEAVTITLANSANYVSGPSRTAGITINDNDGVIFGHSGGVTRGVTRAIDGLFSEMAITR